MAQSLLASTAPPSDGPAGRRTIDLRRFLSNASQSPTHDLVVAAFALSDLPDDALRMTTVEHLWGLTRGLLVLVERGTPEGARVIAEARRHILSREGYVAVSARGEETTLDGAHRGADLHIVAPVSTTACPYGCL